MSLKPASSTECVPGLLELYRPYLKKQEEISFLGIIPLVGFSLFLKTVSVCSASNELSSLAAVLTVVMGFSMLVALSGVCVRTAQFPDGLNISQK